MDRSRKRLPIAVDISFVHPPFDCSCTCTRLSDPFFRTRRVHTSALLHTHRCSCGWSLWKSSESPTKSCPRSCTRRALTIEGASEKTGKRTWSSQMTHRIGLSTAKANHHYSRFLHLALRCCTCSIYVFSLARAKSLTGCFFRLRFVSARSLARSRRHAGVLRVSYRVGNEHRAAMCHHV